jgi:hypothetical protein
VPGSKPSPMETAMQLSSTQQQQQYRSGATAGSPGSSGNAYRALSLPGPAATVGGSSTSALTGLPSGSSLLGALTGPLSMSQTAAGGHGTQVFSSAVSGNSSFWTSAEDNAGPAAAAAAAEAAAAAADGSGPSRLSRLSRPGGPGTGPVGTAVATGAVQLPGGTAVHHKAMASLHSQTLAARAATDAFQQQDQGLGRQRSGIAGFRSSSEPQSPSAGGTSGDYRDSSVEGQPGSSISPMSGATGSMSGQQQQGLGQGHAVTAGRSPAAATAAAAGSPSAGLATLMQALDTTGNGAGGSAGQAGPGHVASSCGQQQAAVMMDM